ncbi:MAG: hypothetical protein HY072_05680, partial [Deltaproteobacteria bacterium]|nr:hypothetical protein [Deltaproteobacteria bacterium]
MAISSKFIYKLILLVIVFYPKDLFCQENPSFLPAFPTSFPGIKSLAVENLSCDPDSPFLERLSLGADLAFCAQWNPDFVFNGHHCCPKKSTFKSKGRP